MSAVDPVDPADPVDLKTMGGFGRLQAVLPLAAVIIDFCWLYPWVLFASGMLYGQTATPLLPAGPAFFLLLAGSVTVRWIAAQPWSLLRIRAAVLGFGFVAGLVAVKSAYYAAYSITDLRWLGALLVAAHDALPEVLPAVTGAFTAALLWWRGVVLGGRDFNYVEIDRLFRGGLAWSVIYVILFALYAETRAFALAGDAPAYLLAFFSFSLLALALARLIDLWTQTHADEQQAWASNRHWLMLLVGVVGLIVLATVLLSGALPSDLRPLLVQLYRPFAPIIEAIFVVIFWVALQVAKVIIYVVYFIARLGGRRVFLRPAQGDPLGDLLKRLRETQVDPGVVSGMRWGMVLLVVGLLCLLIAITIVRVRRRQRKPEEDERESVWSTRAALAGLGAALRRWWNRLRPIPTGAEPTHVAAIREIYRHLLRWAAEHGARRRLDQTPYEFLPQLRAATAPQDAHAAAITETYVAVRYTPHEATPEEVDEVRRHLEEIISASPSVGDAASRP